jgi:hypothetical protein
MKLAVCGDSWFSADNRYPGSSFGEIIANALGFEHISLGRGGCSNFSVRLQIDKSIELGAEFVIVGCTTSDRLEVPIINEKTEGILKKLEKTFTWNDWFKLQPEVYDKRKGLANIYPDKHSVSSSLPIFDSPTMISESINNMMFFEDSGPLGDEQRKALKYYMLNLFDSNIKKQIDCWVISDGCRKLIEHNIPFVIFIEPLYHNEFVNDIKWIPDECIIWPDDWSMWNVQRDHQAVFHYTVADGGRLISDFLLPRIKKLLGG